MSQSYTIAIDKIGVPTMSKDTRNKLSAAALAGTIFCAFWLLLSAQAAVQHFNQVDEGSKHWTVKAIVPDPAN